MFLLIQLILIYISLYCLHVFTSIQKLITGCWKVVGYMICNEALLMENEWLNKTNY